MLALTNEGEIYAWGLNSYGQLGIGVGHTTATNVNGRRLYAAKVIQEIDTGTTDEAGNTIYDYPNLNNIKQISAGNTFSAAVTNDGNVLTWGLGTTGQLGNGTKYTSYYPTPANIEDVKKVSCRRTIHTCTKK